MAATSLGHAATADPAVDFESGFRNPPVTTRPRVYCFVMDGNLTREGITAELEGLKSAGIGGWLCKRRYSTCGFFFRGCIIGRNNCGIQVFYALTQHRLLLAFRTVLNAR